jgi:hypothetical protein
MNKPYSRSLLIIHLQTLQTACLILIAGQWRRIPEFADIHFSPPGAASRA